MNDTFKLGLGLTVNGFLHFFWVMLAWSSGYKFWAIAYVVLGLFFIGWGYKVMKCVNPMREVKG